MTNPHHHDGHHHKREPWHDLPDGFVEFLELEARIGGPQRETVMARAVEALEDAPRRIADLGSGVGVDAVLLATHFPAAEVHALDASSALLERVETAAKAAGVQNRIKTHRIDLNGDWTEVLSGEVDLAWASLALHHLDDPAGAVRQVYDALRPGGMLVLTELLGGVRLTPADLGTGNANLGARIEPALSAPPEYARIDWQSLLEQAGFATVTRTEHGFSADASTPDGAKYLQMQFQSLRERLAGELSDGDLAQLDAVTSALSTAGSGLRLTSARSVWIATRTLA